MSVGAAVKPNKPVLVLARSAQTAATRPPPAAICGASEFALVFEIFRRDHRAQRLNSARADRRKNE